MTFSSDGKWLATASRDRTARVWDATDGREILRLPHEETVHKVKFSPDGRRLATYIGKYYGETGIVPDYKDDYTKEDLLQVWDVSSGKPTDLTIQGYVRDFSFDPAGEQLATAEGVLLVGHDERGMERYRKELGFIGVRIWSITSGQELMRLPHAHSVSFVAFSPDGETLATYSYTGPVRFWDVRTGSLTQAIASPDENDWNRYIALSRDWAYLATCTYLQDKEVQIWDVVTGEQRANLVHEGRVQGIVFSPDGRSLATSVGSMQSGTAWVWDWGQGRPLVRLTPDGSIDDLRFTPDGSRVVTAGGDKTVRLWLWRADDLIADACSRLERNLTHEEWRMYLGDEPYDKRTCPNLPVLEK